MSQIRVLFVCMGNICRSPMAEGVFRQMVSCAGLSGQIEVDSAGTSGWHEGDPADERARTVALTRGYDLASCVSRPVAWQDYKHFDYILGMDQLNVDTLAQECSTDLEDRIHLFMAFAEGDGAMPVPDPYGGKVKGFETVMDMVEKGAAALLDHIERQHFPQRSNG